MYLSRVEVDSYNRRKIRDLTHVGAYHSWVEDSFPNEAGNKGRSRKLWRLDSLGGRTWLLVVSEEKPDLTKLGKYGVEHTAETKNYTPFLEQIRDGMRYRFRVVLNPVHSVTQGNGIRGRVYPEVTAEKQLEYLDRRAEKNGFQLQRERYTITERGYEVLKKPKMKAVHLCKVAYEGELVVTDRDLLCTALTKGIGKKKAYGFGMMTIIPVPDKVQTYEYRN